jgi:beta-glucosidase
LAKTGKPIVLVVMAGRPLGIGADIDLASAVLYAWHPGTMAGTALADLVFGDFSPSAKLPVTMVKGAGQIPLYYYRKNTGRPADPNKLVLIDDIPRNSAQLSLGFKSMHIDYSIYPLYPFGFGLSYTNFEYGDVVLSENKMSKDGTITAQCKITNTGTVEASEVVQFYTRDLVGSLTRPIKELKGFSRVSLKPGESETVSFAIKASDLEFFNGQAYVVEPGVFHVWIATNSDSGQPVSFELIN